MKHKVDLHLLQRIDRELPYFTDDDEEIRLIAEMLEWKLLEAQLPALGVDGLYVGPAKVFRLRPRGQAALQNDGDTLI